MQKRSRFVSTLLLCLVCGAASFVAARVLMEPAFRAWFSPGFLSAWLRVGQAMRLTGAFYVDADAVTPDKLARRALSGIPTGLDPYSEYLAPDAFDEFQQQTNQTFVGIGVTLQMLDGHPVILRVFSGSGAAESGIEPGDRILQVEGDDTAGQSLDTIISRIKGGEGTRVTLQVVRDGQTAPLTLQVPRRKTHMPTLSEKRILENGTGYLRVSQFESRTAEEIAAALDDFAKNGVRQLVLDLRNNPGGLVTSAVDTVGLFCRKGTLVTTSEGRIRTESHAYTTRREPRAPTLPLAILVNRDSASASEIVSGALQDLKRALIIGDRTHGKGVVQSVFTLNDTDGLKITTARYVLPSGRSIQNSGVQPDIYQPMDRQERTLLALAETWRELGREQEFVRRYGQPPPEDVQLTAALDALKALRR